jgi:hypothetical protein
MHQSSILPPVSADERQALRAANRHSFLDSRNGYVILTAVVWAIVLVAYLIKVAVLHA